MPRAVLLSWDTASGSRFLLGLGGMSNTRRPKPPWPSLRNVPEPVAYPPDLPRRHRPHRVVHQVDARLPGELQPPLHVDYLFHRDVPLLPEEPQCAQLLPDLWVLLADSHERAIERACLDARAEEPRVGYLLGVFGDLLPPRPVCSFTIVAAGFWLPSWSSGCFDGSLNGTFVLRCPLTGDLRSARLTFGVPGVCSAAASSSTSPSSPSPLPASTVDSSSSAKRAPRCGVIARDGEGGTAVRRVCGVSACPASPTT